MGILQWGSNSGDVKVGILKLIYYTGGTTVRRLQLGGYGRDIIVEIIQLGCYNRYMRHCKPVHQSQYQNCATFTSHIW